MTDSTTDLAEGHSGENSSEIREQVLLAIVAKLIVRPSFERCCAFGNDFFDQFYVGLADRAPVGNMFASTNMKKQNSLLKSGINQLILFAEGDHDAQRELERLGRRHNRHDLDVSPEFYPAWVDALVGAVEEFDEQCTPDLQFAWREVVAKGIQVIISLY